MPFQWELISERKNGKLAKCWLSATLSSKAFHKKYRPSTINNINVCQTCDYIRNVIERNNDETYGKCSPVLLYLASQLAYGVVKLWSYQTSNLSNDIINFEKILLHEEISKRNEENYEKMFGFLDVPPKRSARFYRDLNLLSEESDIEIKFRNKMNAATSLEFGALTEKDIALINPSDVDFSLEVFERTHIRCPYEDNGLDVSFGYEQIFPVPEEFNISGAAQEYRKKSTKTILSEDILEMEHGKTITLTPQKRQSYNDTHIETPSKKRRLRFEDEPDVDKNVVTAMPETGIAPISAIDHLLELPEISSLEMERKSIKRKVFADKNKKLSFKMINKWINNIYITTMPLNIPNINMPMSDILFKAPSTNFTSKYEKKWNNSLSALFHMHTVTQPEQEIMSMRYEELLEKSSEVARTKNLNDKSNLSELLSGFEKTLESSAHTKSVTTELRDISLLQKTVYKETSTLRLQQEVIPPPIVEENLEDLVQNFELLNTEKPIHPDLKIHEEEKEKYQGDPKLSPSCSLTKQDLFVLLENYLEMSEMIKFTDVIQPDYYNRNDIASCFIYLLELHKEKKITLEQARPYDILWIKKYLQ